MTITLEESLSKAGKNLMYKEYFYGMYLMMMNKRFTEAVDTAGVALDGIRFELAVNPKFWMNQTENHQVGLLKHECCHIIYGHLTDFDHLDNHEVANMAQDIMINQTIGKENLPPGGLFPETYPDLNLKLEKGTQYYYDELMKAMDGGHPDVCATISAIRQRQGKITLSNGKVIQAPQHDWEPVRQLSEAAKRLTKRQAEKLLQNAAEAVQKSRGTIPGDIALILERIANVAPPSFDWRGYMRRFVGKSAEVYTRKTQRKKSKRYPDNPGLKIKQKKHALVAWDTSGSVSERELCEFHKELYHMQRMGIEVTMIQADAQINKKSIKKFNHRDDVTVYGRGGTSFQPVIDYYRENLHKYSCLIYFTDGEAPAPEGAEGNILWVLSEESKMNDQLPGQVIQLN